MARWELCRSPSCYEVNIFTLRVEQGLPFRSVTSRNTGSRNPCVYGVAFNVQRFNCDFKDFKAFQDRRFTSPPCANCTATFQEANMTFLDLSELTLYGELPHGHTLNPPWRASESVSKYVKYGISYSNEASTQNMACIICYRKCNPDRAQKCPNNTRGCKQMVWRSPCI